MDPLSDVLQLLKPKNYRSGGFDAGPDCAVRFGPHPGIKCYAVLSGQGWLVVEGVAEPVLVRAGDCFLLPRGWPFQLTTDLALTPVDAMTIFPLAPNGSFATIRGGGTCFVAGGHFLLEGKLAGILLKLLPPIVHIREEGDRAEMRWSLERMRQELREPRPGGYLVAQQLAYMMLVLALRLHLAEGVKGGVGWLFALADSQMTAAITAIHDAPGRRWTVEELAHRAGMSRSTFAQRFKEKVGKAPMEYLMYWRMLLAADRLTHSEDSISEIALALGYESESAFGTAFKRVMGCSPRRYGRGRDAAAHATHEMEAARSAEAAGSHHLELVAG